MKRLQSVLIVLVMLFFATMWLGWMLQPLEMAPRWHLVPQDAMGLNNLRGDVGGVFLMVVAFCALYLRGRNPAWLQAGAVALAAVLAGRVIGMLVDGFRPDALASALIETAIIAVFLWTARAQNDS